MIDKVAPNDLELEKLVLGAILLETNIINEVITIITHDDVFYNERNKRVWGAIRELHNTNQPIDVVTVFECVKRKYKGDSKDIALYISQLSNSIGSSAHTEVHCRILMEMYLRRRIIQISSLAERNAYDNTQDAFDVYDKVLSDCNAVNNEINRIQGKSWKEIIEDKVSHLKEAPAHGYTTGMRTFLTELDRVTLGWQDGDLIIVAARPSMGKTALIVDIARKQASKLQVPVGIFSLEMSESSIADRMISAETMIPLESLRKGGLNFNDWQRFDSQQELIKEYPIHIHARGGITKNEMRAIAKNWKIKFGVKAIYIDYLQLMSDPENKSKSGNREQEISAISRSCKQLAMELQIPVIALSQLSRACEGRSDKRPILSDLRESGAIEQDADIVIFPYRDEYYNDSSPKGVCELIIAKNRNGKVGKVECYFNADIQLFSNQDPF